LSEHQTQRDHAAEGVTEQVAALDADRIEKGRQVAGQRVEVVATTGVAGAAVAALVRRHGSAERRERLQDVEEVVVRAREAVHQDEGPPARARLFVLDLEIPDANPLCHGRILACLDTFGPQRRAGG